MREFLYHFTVFVIAFAFIFFIVSVLFQPLDKNMNKYLDEDRSLDIQDYKIIVRNVIITVIIMGLFYAADILQIRF